MDQTMNERVCAEINLDHARMNMQALCREAAPAEVMAVVKANGYGHGAVDCGRAFVEGGATWLAVATVDEAIELQDAGIDAKILILSLVEEPRETDALSRGFRVVVGDTATGRRLATKAKQLGIQAPVHLKLDTGMSRIGFDARTDASEQIRQLVQETHGSSLSASSVTSTPSMRMEPESGRSSMLMQRTSVDFPAPDRPMMP